MASIYMHLSLGSSPGDFPVVRTRRYMLNYDIHTAVIGLCRIPQGMGEYNDRAYVRIQYIIGYSIIQSFSELYDTALANCHLKPTTKCALRLVSTGQLIHVHLALFQANISRITSLAPNDTIRLCRTGSQSGTGIFSL